MHPTPIKLESSLHVIPVTVDSKSRVASNHPRGHHFYIIDAGESSCFTYLKLDISIDYETDLPRLKDIALSIPFGFS